MSSHASYWQEQDYAAWARSELVVVNGRLAESHRALKSARVPLLAISYADLLYNTGRTITRIQHFLPCIGALNASWLPTMGEDIYEANELKVKGSVADFASSEKVQKVRRSLELSDDGGSLVCRSVPGKGHEALPMTDRQYALEAEAYLLQQSSMK